MNAIVSASFIDTSLPWIVAGAWLLFAAAGLWYFQTRLPPAYGGAAWCGAAARWVPTGRSAP